MPTTHSKARLSGFRVLALLIVAGAASAGGQSFGPYPAGTTVYVDARNGAPGSGTPSDPYRSLQVAIDAAAPGDQVGAAPGAYLEVIVMQDGVDVVGWDAQSTSIDAERQGSTVTCANARLEGFRLLNGSEFQVDCGNGAAPTIAHNIIAGDESFPIWLVDSAATITDNYIVADWSIGDLCPCDGIESWSSTPLIQRNTIDGSDEGGNVHAIALNYFGPSSPAFEVRDNYIIGRVIVDDLQNGDSAGKVIADNVFYSSNGYSEAIDVFNGSVWIVNNTIVGGSGIVLQEEQGAYVYNNNVVHDPMYVGIEDCSIEDSVLSHNNVFPAPPQGTHGCRHAIPGQDGNIAVDPGFVNSDAGDYHLTAESRLIDAGDATVPVLPATDYDGLPRIFGASVDIGAYEFQAVDSDSDGLVDTEDNCIDAANPDQRDTDADGIGNYCDGDFNQDCHVNFIDLGSMKGAFFHTGARVQDLNGDGVVNFGDLGRLKQLFFAPPGPSGLPNICDGSIETPR